MQKELKIVRRVVGRPNGSRKNVSVTASLNPWTVFSNQHQNTQSSGPWYFNQMIAEGNKICDLKAKCTEDQASDNYERFSEENSASMDILAWIDCLSFTAESDPFHSDWPHW